MNTVIVKKCLPLLALLILSFGAMASPGGPKAPKTSTVVIHTSANCGECKVTIETALSKVKGIKKSTLDVATHDATVIYSPKKLNEEAIRKAITMAGYDADGLKANQEAHDNLPACCRKGGHE